jgi:dTDP-4-amino-4,6-dideoxygalactose transaminase
MVQIIESRMQVIHYYNMSLDFTKLQKLKIREYTEWNNSYYPVILESEERLVSIQKKLNELQIFPRRYFYPSLNTIPYAKGKNMPISESIASRILCLPLYVGLERREIDEITNLLND